MNTETLANQNLSNRSMPHPGPDDKEDIAPQDMGEFLDEYQPPRRGDICTGVVINVEEGRGLTVDVGLKREGLVPAKDLEHLDEETIAKSQKGDTVSVFVLQPEGRDGYPILSIHQAQLHQDWLKAEEMMKKNELYESEISGYNKGGLLTKFGEIRGFIPASQVVGIPRGLSKEERRHRLESKVGQKVGLKIIEVDRRRRRLIFSQRRALRAWQKVQRGHIMEELTEGETEKGKVTSLTNFGAFVDLGGADGLIHISELSWKRVNHPREVVSIGDEVEVFILNLDWDRKRIALSLKRLEPDPWSLVDEHYKVGQIVKGKITRVLDFGAFVALDLGVEGLLHVSEMIGTPELAPSDVVHPGETLPVKILRIDSNRKRLALSAKQVQRSEWERWVAEQQAQETEDSAEEKEETAAEPEAEAEPELKAKASAAEDAAEAKAEPEAEAEAKAAEEEEATAEPEAEEDTADPEAEAEPEAETEANAAKEEEATAEPEAAEDAAEDAADPEAEAEPEAETEANAAEEEEATAEPEAEEDTAEAGAE